MLSKATSITPISCSFGAGSVFYTWVNFRCKLLGLVGQFSAQINTKEAFFPTISLTGLYGSLSLSWDNLLTGPMKQWSYGGSASMHIFTAGGLMGQLTGAEAHQKACIGAIPGCNRNRLP
jgi:hypothetical protein